MEVMLQYLDDIEDAIYAVALSAEQIRRLAVLATLPVLICVLALSLFRIA